MPKFKTRGILIHDNVEYPDGSIIELDNETAAQLVKSGVLTPTKEEVLPDQKNKIVDKFASPTSTSEIEKAAVSASLVPNKRGRCPKCKTEREVKNPQVFQSEKGAIRMIGECAICGTRISRICGRVKIEKE